MKKESSVIEIAAFTGIAVFLLFKLGEKYVITMIDRKTFIETMLPIADKIKRDYAIEPIITITQAAHESNWGNSGLSKDAYNLFGFTAGSWSEKGYPTVTYKTYEYINGERILTERAFRAYKSWFDSTNDWASVISSRSRYKNAYEAAKTGNVPLFSKEIQDAGYATDPKYAGKIM